MTMVWAYVAFALLCIGVAKKPQTSRTNDNPVVEEGEALLSQRMTRWKIDIASENTRPSERSAASIVQTAATCDPFCETDTSTSWWKKCKRTECHGCQTCVDKGCTVPENVANAHPDGICAEGSFVPYANRCTVKCRDGTSPTISWGVTCDQEFKNPLECLPDGCRMGWVDYQASTGLCTSGSSELVSGSACEMNCDSGYVPSTPTVNCFEGQLTPQTYSCEPEGCSAHSGIENAASPSCAEGPTLGHDQKCSARCKPGYLPNFTSTTCRTGKLEAFECVEMWPKYGTGYCQNSDRESLRFWQKNADDCKADCEAQTWCSFYTFSLTAPENQRCVIFSHCRGVAPSHSGTDYSSHTVYKRAGVADCAAPTSGSVSNGASLSCLGQPIEFNSDATIYWNSICTTVCAEGFEPNVASLHCTDGGVLSPPSFACSGKPCVIGWVTHEASGGVCDGGRDLAHGSSCPMLCKEGFSPSVDVLSCDRGQLTPSTYSCSPTSCSAPSVAFSSASSCAEGPTIAHDSTCTPACSEGYFPDSTPMTCRYGQLSNFTCVKHWPIKGNGGCSASNTQWEQWKHDPASCQEACGNQDHCHFFSFNPAAPRGQRCLRAKTCDEVLTTFDGIDLTGYTLYHAENAQECAAPPQLSAPGSDAKLNCEGRTVAFGGDDVLKFAEVCEMTCAEGYIATADRLRCGDGGLLDPPTIKCEEKNCEDFGGKIDFAGTQNCKEGVPVESGTDCTPNCLEGYSPSHASLSCSKGVLTPARFDCTPASCDPGEVVNSPPNGVCNGTKIGHWEHCYPKCADGYYPTQYQLDCRFGEFLQSSVACESRPTWWVEEWICRNAADGWEGRRDCSRKWVPPEVQSWEDDCSKECDLHRLLGNTLPSFCSRCTREEALRLWDAGALTYPTWRKEYYRCRFAETYTGFSPPMRTGLPGCYWISEWSANHVCEEECVVGQPIRVRRAMLQCKEDCYSASYTGLSDENETNAKNLCIDMCLKTVTEILEKEDEANELVGGNGSTDTVSSEALQKVAQKIVEVETSMKQMEADSTSDAQQALSGLMHAHLSIEEAVRMAGSSGVTKVRNFMGGSRSYLEASHTTSGPQASHNHANGLEIVGLGELAAVINGVSFRTRHNDYSLVMPGKAPMAYHATEPLPKPDVPPEVLQAGSVEDQIREMRLYFKAFKDQNVSLRDYRPYFKPVLCYLEGAWEDLKGDDLVEPFVSDRHHIAATGWKDLLEKVRFFDYGGGKDRLENIPWLPTTVLNMAVVDGRLVPKLAKWSYRILCHPIDGDVETVRLIPQLRDWASFKRSFAGSWAKYADSRSARFKVHPYLGLQRVRKQLFSDITSTRNYLDLLMEQIPGKDGYGANLTDEIMNGQTSRLEPYLPGDPDRELWGTAINGQNVEGPLNVAYYSRYFNTAADAMGRGEYRRGYNDVYLWAARTTQQEVAKMSMINSGSEIKPGDICAMEDGTPCPRIEQSWTYALPIEIIYLFPLMKWNPYNIETPRHPEAGDGTEQNPYTSAGWRNKFYITPVEFYGKGCATEDVVDAADTSAGAKWVTGGDGVVRLVKASGVVIRTECIEGIGKVRQRYNIMPLHSEGNVAYKEVQALGAMVLARQIPDGNSEPEGRLLELGLTEASDGHKHELIFNSDEIDTLRNGTATWVTSSFVEGHTHQVKVAATHNPNDVSSHDWVYDMRECLTGGKAGPNPPFCVDGHQAIRFEFETV